jgi:hypothetical protein
MCSAHWPVSCLLWLYALAVAAPALAAAAPALAAAAPAVTAAAAPAAVLRWWVMCPSSERARAS